MQVIPAIDVKGGKCVRLRQGEFNKETIYSDSPLTVATQFEEHGARRLHVVDLDGARGQRDNRAIITELIAELSIPVQIGGGVRSLLDIDYWIEQGAARVVVGTLAVKAPEIFLEALAKYDGERLILAVDARDGQVAVSGWREVLELSAVELALSFREDGLQRLLYTDISRDGMLTGPNVVATQHVAAETGMKVIASGGVSSLADIHALEPLRPFGVESVVVGRAFYESKIKPAEVFGAR